MDLRRQLMEGRTAIPRVGSVAQVARTQLPFVVLDDNGAEVEPVSQYLRELVLGDCSPLTCRSYAQGLLRWFRLLWVLDVGWERATESDVAVMVAWLRTAPNPQRERSAVSPAAGSVNLVTGKPALGPGYSKRTINHALSVVSGFYEYHGHYGRGPVVNPVPSSAERRRALSHLSPLEPKPVVGRARLRQKVPARPPRAIPDERWDELFAAMGCERDRALLEFSVSSGARAAELLGVWPEDVDWAGRQVYVISKGTRRREPVPASPQAFIHLAHYLDECGPRRLGEPVWRARRGPDRPLSYWALRRVLQRADDLLGANWSWHAILAHGVRQDGVQPGADASRGPGHHAARQHPDHQPIPRGPRRGDLRQAHPALQPAPARHALPGRLRRRRHHRRVRRWRRPVNEITARRTTGVSRRHGPTVEELGFPSRYHGPETRTEPAVAAAPPQPHGDLSAVPVSLLAQLARDTWAGDSCTVLQRAQAARGVLQYLLDFPGSTWQQRWEASPLGRGEITVGSLGSRRTTGASFSPGLRSLFCLRAIRPSNLALRLNTFQNYSEFFVQAQHDPLLDKFIGHAGSFDAPWPARRDAAHELCCLLTVQGVALSDVTPGALLHHAHETRRAKASMPNAGKSKANRFAGRATWDVLHSMGMFPPGTPLTMRAALTRGQRPVEELVDQYPIRDQAVRQLLIDYFQRRAADLDYASLKTLVLTLAHHFWENIETVSPGQADLRISPETYEAWRNAIRVKDDGRERRQQDTIVLVVRSFYYDLHTWAADEPEIWARWVAPCPVPPGELRGLASRRRRVNERSAERTRQRQPLLPLLVKYVEDRYDHTRAVLERAREAAENEEFTVDGMTYQRIITDSARRHARHDALPLRLLDQATGRAFNAATEEETAFWDWACVETLRHSGIRIEELSELTHLSVRQYRRQNGEVIALLVIAPSKTDRERVIPMSAELFHVIASIIRRHTKDGKAVPLISRYDSHDKVWSPPMPFLFQHATGTTSAVFTPSTVIRRLERCGNALAADHPAFKTVSFRPHDFRRIFATELVNSGLPIHIGAALLGHLNIQTTRGYVAVFDEDVVRHYAAFLAGRRAVRPAEEYRHATAAEWLEFEEHFDKRKVELGSCGRPYGSPCQHEHACLRCPVLHVSPKMLARLDELEADLLTRRARAEAEHWLGEIEGIDLTLGFLRTKRDDTRRRTQRPAVDLGIPVMRPGKETR